MPEEVFKNIQVMKGVPPGRCIRQWIASTHRSAWVCDLCHVSEKFELEDRLTKQVARRGTTQTSSSTVKYLDVTYNFVQTDTHTYCCNGYSNPCDIPVSFNNGSVATDLRRTGRSATRVTASEAVTSRQLVNADQKHPITRQ
jgi:hypothetical protein